MDRQGLFYELEARRRSSDRLFFALRPPPPVSERIVKDACNLRSRFRLAGRVARPDRLHVTLYSFPVRKGLPVDLVALAGQAADRVAAAPFDVAFSYAESFLGKPNNRPLVLRAAPDEAWPLAHFQALLNGVLVRAGLAPGFLAAYTPHVTVLYDDRAVAPCAIAPVRWTADEFVLIHSLVGRTQHIECGRWRLKACPAARPEAA